MKPVSEFRSFIIKLIRIQNTRKYIFFCINFHINLFNQINLFLI
jgi:hypothetical protein